MEETMDNVMNNKNVQDEVQALKSDMKDILSRLASLKDHSKGVISEQFGDLFGKMNDLSGQGVEKGKEYMHNVEEYIKEKPLMSTAYAFGAGVLLAALLKR
jgi:ElaB/YqjD/DUF883 family membrane-anchored ribosome-binding protein